MVKNAKSRDTSASSSGVATFVLGIQMDRYRFNGRNPQQAYPWPREVPAARTLNKRISELQREEQLNNMEHRQNQKAIHRDLMNIRAAKNAGNRMATLKNRRESRVFKESETIQDMINRFTKRRIEQTMVNDLLRQRRESLMKIEDDMRRRSPSKIWDTVTESRADCLRMSEARKSHDNIVNDIKRGLTEEVDHFPIKDADIENYLENIQDRGDFHKVPYAEKRRRSTEYNDEERVQRSPMRKRSIENEPSEFDKIRRRSLENTKPVISTSTPRRVIGEWERRNNTIKGPFQRRKSLQIEQEYKRHGGLPKDRISIEEQTDMQALRNIQRELPIYALSRPPPVYLSEKNVRKQKDGHRNFVIDPEYNNREVEQNRSTSRPNMFNNAMKKLRGQELSENGSKYLKKSTNVNQNMTDEEKRDDPPVPLLEKEYTLIWSPASDLSSEEGRTSADETWDDVRRCKYLRGYDPPEMIMPKEEVNLFVFGRNENDIMDMKRAERRRSLSSQGGSIPEEILV